MAHDHATLEATQQSNLAESLARLLPKADILNDDVSAGAAKGLLQVLVAQPKGTDIRTIDIDLEKYLPNPRSTVAAATLADLPSFLAYVARHADDNSVVWCNFNPQSFQLSFTAVIDEHAKGTAGWRRHKAVYQPAMSAEWNTWTKNNGSQGAKGQVEFAEFLERVEGDIATKEGFPTSAQMMKMATSFEVTGEKRLRSSVRLQNGSVQLEYIDKEDEATVERMSLFERFVIGIPVLWAGPGYFIEARLKHRISAGKASFHYELIRPDRVHEAAAKDLIEQVRVGIGLVPLLTGVCS